MKNKGIKVSIIKVAIEIFKEAIDMMLDRSCDEQLEQDLKNIINKHKDVKNIDMLKTRQFSTKVYVDIEISLDKNMSVYDSHKVAEIIHDEIEETHKEVKHCMIHVNPY